MRDALKFGPRTHQNSRATIQIVPTDAREPCWQPHGSFLARRWREPDSKHRCRVTPPRVREGLMSPLLDPANGEVGANVNRHEDDLGRLARNWKFESIPLHRGVTNEPRGCSKQRRARTVERTRRAVRIHLPPPASHNRSSRPCQHLALQLRLAIRQRAKWIASSCRDFGEALIA